MKRIVTLMILLTVCWALPSGILAAEPVGSVTFVKGSADITRTGSPAAPLYKGEDIYVGDILRTKTGAKVEVTFIDESVVRIAQKSRLEITEYMFDREERRSILNLFRGKVQSLVKKVAGFSFGWSRKNRFEVHTPTAVCGVRGTDFFTWYINGQTGTAFKEGRGYIYPVNKPQIRQNVETGQSGLVAEPDAAPVVKPATDAELEQHLEETVPAEGEEQEGGEGEGEGGQDDGGATLTLTEPEAGDTGDGVDGGGVDDLAKDDKTIIDLREIEDVTGVTLFSGEANLGFFSGGRGAISGEIDDIAGKGPVSLTGTLDAPIGPGATASGAILGQMTLPDEQQVGAFTGKATGVGGSWEGMFVSLYAQLPEGSAGGPYDAGFLYGGLSSGADYRGASAGQAFSAEGTAFRQPYGRISLIPAAGQPLEEALSQATVLASGHPTPALGELAAGEPVFGSLTGDLTTLELLGGRVLGVYSEPTQSSFENPDGRSAWSDMYGQKSSGSYYILGRISAEDDRAVDLEGADYGHTSASGLLSYMDRDYYGTVNLYHRGTYDDQGGYHAVNAGAVDKTPLFQKGEWGGGGLPIGAGSLYGNQSGEMVEVGSDIGIAGGRTAAELIVYGEYAGISPAAGDSYLFNSAVMTIAGDEQQQPSEIGYNIAFTGGTWKMQPEQEGISYGSIEGSAAGIYLQAEGIDWVNETMETAAIGFVASQDLYGRFYPGLGNSPDEGMWNAVGTWVRSPAMLTLTQEQFDADLFLDEGGFYDVALFGDYSGAGDIQGLISEGSTLYIRTFQDPNDTIGTGLPWGAYDLKLGVAGANYFSGKPVGDEAVDWRAMLAGKADFGEPGYFMAEIDDGKWTGTVNSTLSGTMTGNFLTLTHYGQIGGPFYGINNGTGDSGTWVGQSIGFFEPTAALAYSGSWPSDPASSYSYASLPACLYRDSWTAAAEEYGIFGGLSAPWTPGSGAADLMAFGSYDPSMAPESRYLWNASFAATPPYPVMEPWSGGGDPGLAGFAAGTWSLDPANASLGGIDANAAAVYMGSSGLLGLAVIPSLQNGAYYPLNGFWTVDGAWQQKRSIQSPEFETYIVDSGGIYQANTAEGIALSGSFSGAAQSTVTAAVNTDSMTRFFSPSMTAEMLSPQVYTIGQPVVPFGIYNLKLEGAFSAISAGDADFATVTGGYGDFDAGYDGYWLAGLSTSWNGQTGAIAGSLGGDSMNPSDDGFSLYLTRNQMGTLGGPASGLFFDAGTGSGTWIGQSAGTFQGERLAFGGDAYGALMYYDGGILSDDSAANAVYGLLGSTAEDLLTGGTGTVTILGDYRVSAAAEQDLLMYGSGVYIGANSFMGSSGTGGAFKGYTVGNWTGGQIDALAAALYIQDSASQANQAGLLLGPDGLPAPMTGRYFEGPGMFTASSDMTIGSQSFATAYSSADLSNGYALASEYFYAPWGGYADFGSGVSLAAQVVSGDPLRIEDQDWGIWNAGFGGNFYGPVPDLWKLHTGSDAYSGADGSWIGHIEGTGWGASDIAGNYKMRTLTPDFLYEYEGKIIGTRSGEGQLGDWQAAGIGIFDRTSLTWYDRIDAGEDDLFINSQGDFFPASDSVSGGFGLVGNRAVAIGTYTYNSQAPEKSLLSVPLYLDRVGGIDAARGYLTGHWQTSITDGIPTEADLNLYAGLLHYDSGQGAIRLLQGAMSGGRYNLSGPIGVFEIDSIPQGLTATETPVSPAGTVSFVDVGGSEAFLSASFDGISDDTIKGYGSYGPESLSLLYESDGSTDRLLFPGIVNLRFSSPENVFGAKPGGTASWSGMAGGVVDSVEWLFWLATAGGTWDEEGVIQGQIGADGADTAAFGRFMSETAKGRIAGPVQGLNSLIVIDDNTYWTGQGTAVLTKTEDLGFSAMVFEAGGLTGILGGTGDLGAATAAAPAQIDLLGQYDPMASGPTVLFAELESTGVDPNIRFAGYTTGVLIAQQGEGDVFALYDSGGEAGLLRGQYAGAYHDGVNMLEAAGTVNRVPLFDNLGSVSLDGKQFDRDRFLAFSGEKWGVRQSILDSGAVAAEEVGANGQWLIEYQTYDMIAGYGAEVTQQDRKLDGETLGYWADLSDVATGVSAGLLKGTFDPNSMDWQAAVGSNFAETLWLLQQSETAAGKELLAKLNIPAVEVGTATLTQSGGPVNGIENLQMADLKFLSHAAGGDPSIWAAPSVTGQFSAAPMAGGPAVPLDGGGLTAQFQVKQWADGAWGAGVGGSGNLNRTDVSGTVDLEFTGAAAGTYSGTTSGDFSGTGAGIAKPGISPLD